MSKDNTTDNKGNDLSTTYVMTIGDWSCDGHNYYKKYAIKTNQSLLDIQKAYLKSCENAGVRFHHDRTANDNVTEICTKYEQSTLNEQTVSKLIAFGVDAKKYISKDDDDYEFEDCQDFALMILEFTAQSLSDFTYEIITVNKSTLSQLKNINGFWNDVMNEQFGYGLFNDCNGLFDNLDYHG